VESLKTVHNIEPAAKQQQYKAQVIKLLNQCIKGTIRNSRAVIDTLKRLAIDDMSDDVVTAGVMNALHRLEINADCAAHFTRALIGIIDAVNVHMCQGSMKTMLLERGFLALTRNCVIRCNHVNLNEKILQLLAKELQADTNEQLIFVVLQGMLELGTHDSYLGKPTKHLGAKAVVEMIEKVNKNETMDPFLRQEILKLSLQTFKSEMIVSKMDKKRFLHELLINLARYTEDDGLTILSLQHLTDTDRDIPREMQETFLSVLVDTAARDSCSEKVSFLVLAALLNSSLLGKLPGEYSGQFVTTLQSLIENAHDDELVLISLKCLNEILNSHVSVPGTIGDSLILVLRKVDQNMLPDNTRANCFIHGINALLGLVSKDQQRGLLNKSFATQVLTSIIENNEQDEFLVEDCQVALRALKTNGVFKSTKLQSRAIDPSLTFRMEELFIPSNESDCNAIELTELLQQLKISPRSNPLETRLAFCLENLSKISAIHMSLERSGILTTLVLDVYEASEQLIENREIKENIMTCTVLSLSRIAYHQIHSKRVIRLLLGMIVRYSRNENLIKPVRYTLGLLNYSPAAPQPLLLCDNTADSPPATSNEDHSTRRAAIQQAGLRTSASRPAINSKSKLLKDKYKYTCSFNLVSQEKMWICFLETAADKVRWCNAIFNAMELHSREHQLFLAQKQDMAKVVQAQINFESFKVSHVTTIAGLLKVACKTKSKHGNPRYVFARLDPDLRISFFKNRKQQKPSYIVDMKNGVKLTHNKPVRVRSSFNRGHLVSRDLNL